MIEKLFPLGVSKVNKKLSMIEKLFIHAFFNVTREYWTVDVARFYNSKGIAFVCGDGEVQTIKDDI